MSNIQYTGVKHTILSSIYYINTFTIRYTYIRVCETLANYSVDLTTTTTTTALCMNVYWMCWFVILFDYYDPLPLCYTVLCIIHITLCDTIYCYYDILLLCVKFIYLHTHTHPHPYMFKSSSSVWVLMFGDFEMSIDYVRMDVLNNIFPSLPTFIHTHTHVYTIIFQTHSSRTWLGSKQDV